MRKSGEVADDDADSWLTTSSGSKDGEEVGTSGRDNEVDTQTEIPQDGNMWSIIRNRDLEPRRELGVGGKTFGSWLCRDDA